MATFSSYDGTEISYRTLGSGPPLLVVPGGPRASAYLEDLGGLDRHRTLVLFDARGTGASPAPAEPATYAYPRLAEDVEALRAHLGHEQLDVLGHSAGAVVAQAYAAAHAGRIRRLVLVAPGYQLYGLESPDTAQILAGRTDQPWYPQATAALRKLSGLSPDASPSEVIAILEEYAPAAYGHWGERQQAHLAQQPAQFSVTAWAGFWRSDVDVSALVDRLAKVTAPVAVLTGSRDALTGVAVGDFVANLFPAGRHVTIDGAGHYPWVDEPAAFATAVEEFLS
ncbi:alpha/beta fold hydrolase [Amycolatopsis sp. lyj-23]|uniref:alpha/beta fold hydrolase n=1 Tax=Amycolatopsis sp. lyj-23 TaxID=2789283 RepID=UPI00397BADAE